MEYINKLLTQVQKTYKAIFKDMVTTSDMEIENFEYCKKDYGILTSIRFSGIPHQSDLENLRHLLSAEDYTIHFDEHEVTFVTFNQDLEK